MRDIIPRCRGLFSCSRFAWLHVVARSLADRAKSTTTERKLECRTAESAPQSADGQTCSQACGEETDYCSAAAHEAECWGGSCVRECEVTAPDCPDGTICAVLTSAPETLGYCVLACMTADDCGGVFMYCPQPGGPCTSNEEEVPPWSS